MTETRDVFERHYRQWREVIDEQEIALSSADEAYVDNPPYRAMVEMGWAAVPYLIEKLRTDPAGHFLIHALSEITGRRFHHDEVQTDSAAGVPGNQAYVKRWLKWWDDNPRIADEIDDSTPPDDA